MFHQSSTKIALSLSGHNVYVKKTSSAKINSLRKPENYHQRNLKNLHEKQQPDVEKIKYL